VDFRLLGPLEVESDGRDLTPARHKQRLLLTALLVRSNEVVSTDELIDVVWSSSPPATAAKALQGHISALRKAIGAGAIETRPPGYVLHVEHGSVDTQRFGGLIEAAADDLFNAATAVVRVVDDGDSGVRHKRIMNEANLRFRERLRTATPSQQALKLGLTGAATAR